MTHEHSVEAMWEVMTHANMSLVVVIQADTNQSMLWRRKKMWHCNMQPSSTKNMRSASVKYESSITWIYPDRESKWVLRHATSTCLGDRVHSLRVCIICTSSTLQETLNRRFRANALVGLLWDIYQTLECLVKTSAVAWTDDQDAFYLNRMRTRNVRLKAK